MKRKGSRTAVWTGKARHTSGCLMKFDLIKTKAGKLVVRPQRSRKAPKKRKRVGRKKGRDASGRFV